MGGESGVIVVGAGGLGREIRDSVEAQHALGGMPFWGYFAADTETAENAHGETTDLLGPAHPAAIPAGAFLIIGVGDPATRRALSERLAVWERWATVVHPSAVVSPRAQLGEGSFVAPLSYVGPGAIVGRHVIVNVHAELAHDCRVGDVVTLSPYAAFNGHAVAGDGCFLGTAATVDVGVNLGRWSKVGAGGRVTRDAPPGSLLLGNPARGRVMFAADAGPVTSPEDR